MEKCWIEIKDILLLSRLLIRYIFKWINERFRTENNLEVFFSEVPVFLFNVSSNLLVPTAVLLFADVVSLPKLYQRLELKMSEGGDKNMFSHHQGPCTILASFPE